MDFSQKYNAYAPNTRKKAKCVAEGTMYQNQLFHPISIIMRNFNLRTLFIITLPSLIVGGVNYRFFDFSG